MKDLEKIAKECNLDSASELDIYFANYKYAEILGHSVVLSVSHDGDTSFVVDGSCEIDNISIMAGACIFRWLLKAFKEITQEIDGGISCFCFPTETDGHLSLRIKAFKKAGFIMSGDRMELKK